MKRAINLILMIVLLLGLSSTAEAGSVLWDPGSSCTTINCETILLPGTYETSPSLNRNPFLVQIFSSGAECVRLDVTSQGTDLEMKLISPSGRIWQNDDRTSIDARPLIKAITDVRGWYTLMLSHWSGAAVSADFYLRYGRYPSGNINCSGATPPIVLIESANANKALSIEEQESLIPGPPTKGPNTP